MGGQLSVHISWPSFPSSRHPTLTCCSSLSPPPAGLALASVQWGAWAAIGMVAGSAAVHRAMDRMGVAMLQPTQGLAAMQALLGAPAAATPAQLAAIPFTWRRFLRAPRHAAAFFYGEHAAELGEPETQQQPLLLAAPAAIHAAPAAAAPAAAAVPSQSEVLQQVLAVVAAVHGASLDPQQPLLQAGLDSLGE